MAQCTGPSEMAYCTLIDRYDGTFELTINPAEVGQHTLEIKYGDEPVPSTYIATFFRIRPLFAIWLWVLYHQIMGSVRCSTKKACNCLTSKPVKKIIQLANRA